MSMKTTEQRFWSHVRKGAKCWNWTAGGVDGYGRLRVGRRMILAHRYSWELHNGPIPADMCVLHSCDVRSCIRPDHLFVGTKLDNSDDMIAKGGQRHTVASLIAARRSHPDKFRGVGCHTAKLDADKVRFIRKLHASGGVTYKELGERFGVSGVNIAAVVTRKSWKHIVEVD